MLAQISPANKKFVRNNGKPEKGRNSYSHMFQHNQFKSRFQFRKIVMTNNKMFLNSMKCGEIKTPTTYYPNNFTMIN